MKKQQSFITTNDFASLCVLLAFALRLISGSEETGSSEESGSSEGSEEESSDSASQASTDDASTNESERYVA